MEESYSSLVGVIRRTDIYILISPLLYIKSSFCNTKRSDILATDFQKNDFSMKQNDFC